jgi:hypothetical protein
MVFVHLLRIRLIEPVRKQIVEVLIHDDASDADNTPLVFRH